tara:strand:- start:1572 stop:1829 length:258 start_codon:yes stop_codon:yes gene_type:complete
MKIFKNISLQGFSVPFATPEGIKYVFIGAKKSFEAPDSWSSKVATTLVTRRMFRITHVATPTPVVEVAKVLPTKNIQKSPLRGNR